MSRLAATQLLRAATWLALGLCPVASQAWSVSIGSGPRRLYLQVGAGTLNSNNSTVNQVSLTVPVASVGNGTELRMNSNSAQAVSPQSGNTACDTSQQQVYVAASYRVPNNNQTAAQLRVQAPAQLTGGLNGDTIPIGQIRWTSTWVGGGGADIPAGTFSAGTQTLRSVGLNTWMENCLTFFYANTATPGAGTYTGTVLFSLVVP